MKIELVLAFAQAEALASTAHWRGRTIMENVELQLVDPSSSTAKLGEAYCLLEEAIRVAMQENTEDGAIGE